MNEKAAFILADVMQPLKCFIMTNEIATALETEASANGRRDNPCGTKSANTGGGFHGDSDADRRTNTRWADQGGQDNRVIEKIAWD